MPGTRRREVLTLAIIAVVAAMVGAGITTLVIRLTPAASPDSYTALGGGGSAPAGGGSGSGGSGSGGGIILPFGGQGAQPGSGESGPAGGGTTPFGGGTGPSAGQGGAGTSPGQHSTASGSPSNAAALASKVDPGLVDVNTSLAYQGLQGAGTGMVLTPSGEILTNNHVVEGETKISVVDVGNGKTYRAVVVGYDRSKDVAVLQLTGASGLATVTPASATTASVGEGVVAIGNAGGAGGTPSWAGGKVTGLNQAISASDQAAGTTEHLRGLIQTNAGIISGDSGGPMVNSAGHVIGMDTAASAGFRFSSSGTRGYAIPISEALAIARQIEAGQSSATVHIGPTAFLGIGVAPASSSRSSASPIATGAGISDVISGGAAARAGLVAGDVITRVAGVRITGPAKLVAVLLTEHPGQAVQVRYVGPSGATHTVTVHLASGPPQ